MWNVVAHIFFFIKTKKMIFPEVTMAIISENTSAKCLQCIKYDNSEGSHSSEKMRFYTYFLQK